MKSSHIARLLQKKGTPRPPSELGKAGRALWNKLCGEYTFEDTAGLTTLLSVCRTEDDIQRMREVVRKEGDTIIGNKGTRIAHPLLPQIRGAENTKRLAMRELNLEISTGGKK